MPNGEKMKEVDQEGTNTYVPQLDKTMNNKEMKGIIRNEYIRKVKYICR